MFELYNVTDNDNTTRTKLSCNICNNNESYIVEFIQSKYSDFNKWGKQKVLTDMIVTKFYLPEIYHHINSATKLKSYIMDNMDEDFGIIEKIGKLATAKHRLSISLPTSISPHKRGLPTGLRTIKDTYLPLIVIIDDQDVSSNFIDFGDFEDNAVATAYQALVQGNIPEHKNDIFYIEGVEFLHKELSNNELGN